MLTSSRRGNDGSFLKYMQKKHPHHGIFPGHASLASTQNSSRGAGWTDHMQWRGRETRRCRCRERNETVPGEKRDGVDGSHASVRERFSTRCWCILSGATARRPAWTGWPHREVPPSSCAHETLYHWLYRRRSRALYPTASRLCTATPLGIKNPH